MKSLDLEIIGLTELDNHEAKNTTGGFLFWLVLGFFVGLAIALNNE